MKTAPIALFLLISSFPLFSSFHLQALTLNGAWKVEAEIEGIIQDEVILFHERNDGSVFGYRLGATEHRIILKGRRTDENVKIAFQSKDPIQTSEASFNGILEGDTLEGSVTVGNNVFPLTLERQNVTFTERTFLFADFSGENPEHITSMSLIFDQSDTFILGNAVGNDDCTLFSCSATVSEVVETAQTLSFTITSDDNCDSTTDINLSFDPDQKTYSGTFEGTNCGDNIGGNMIAIRTNKATSDDIMAMFNILSRIADDLQEDLVFAEPYPEISNDYSYNSFTKAQFLDLLNSESFGFTNKKIDLHSFRKASTEIDPLALPGMASPLGIDFDDHREGIKQGEIESQVYRDTNTTQSEFAELRFFEIEEEQWVLKGNGINLELPFASYTIEEDHVAIDTDGGPIYLSIGPWGAHTGPHTGHIEGNAKADWMGFLARRDFQMTDLTSLGESCVTDLKRGVAESEAMSKVLHYTALADDFEITFVQLERLHPPNAYFGSNEEWIIAGRIKQYFFRFVHAQKVGEDLRQKMLDAGYDDPWTIEEPTENLITGDSIFLNKNEKIAVPLLVAEEILGCPGFLTGKNGIDQTPRYQIEFFTHNSSNDKAESFYRWLTDDLEESLESILNEQGNDTLDYRYGNPSPQPWLWKAEMKLSNQEVIDRSDYSSILSGLGGWFEQKDEACLTMPGENIFCDQMLSIFPISKDTKFYDPLLYHSERVAYLVGYLETNQFSKYGEVINRGSIDDTADQLIIRWRNHEGFETGFQSLSYRLFVDKELLKVHWGPIETDFISVELEKIPDEVEICDGQKITCHTHQFNPKVLDF